MTRDVRTLARLGFAGALLLACCACTEEAPPDITVDESLRGAIEVVSVERLEPGRKNRLELVFRLSNASSRARRVTSTLTWLDDAGRQRGGQSNDLLIESSGQATLTAPTNDRQVASYRLVLSPAAAPAGMADGPAHDPDAIVISAEAVGRTGHATLAVWAPASAVAFDVVIPPADCRRFRFHPGGACEVSATTPAGSTTTIMVAYEATDERPRRGRLRIDFADPARDDLEVPLHGRVGAEPSRSRRITAD